MDGLRADLVAARRALASAEKDAEQVRRPRWWRLGASRLPVALRGAPASELLAARPLSRARGAARRARRACAGSPPQSCAR